jgi:hypothetical protein
MTRRSSKPAVSLQHRYAAHLMADWWAGVAAGAEAERLAVHPVAYLGRLRIARVVREMVTERLGGGWAR